MYDVLIGKQRGLIFPVMCNGHVRIDYSDNTNSSNDNINYGLFSHAGSFTFEAIVTPYDINGAGQWSTSANSIGIETTTETQKVMPSVTKTQSGVSGNDDFRSERYLNVTDRLTHEMMLFSNSKFSISLVNSTTHNQNQPAEYKIKVVLDSQATITDLPVIKATSGFGWSYPTTPANPSLTPLVIDGFDADGRITHSFAGTTDASSSGVTINIDDTSKFHVNQEVFLKDGFNYTSLGTIASVSTGVSFDLANAPANTISTSTKIYVHSYKDACYINNQFHIACSYNDISKEVRLFLNGILVKVNTLTINDFIMPQEDSFIGNHHNPSFSTGKGSTTHNKQFMGEMHEMSMVNTVKKKFLINNLLPNLNDTLFYFRFEEVDE